MPSSRLLLASACLALSMSLVGSYVALSKALVLVFPVMLLAWLRFAIGAAAMLHWLRKPAGEEVLSPRTRWRLFLEAFLGTFLFSIFMLHGVRLTSAEAAGVVMAALPVAVAFMGRALLGERITRSTRWASACAVAAMALLALARHHAQGTPQEGGPAWLGNLLVLFAVLCEAAYAVIGKSLTGVLGARRITALVNLWSLVLVTPFGLYAAASFDFSAVPPGSWMLLLFYGLAASVWSVWLWMTGLRHVPAAQAGVFTVLLPVSAALTGVLALGESLGGLQLGALALALLGVVLATLQGPRARSA